MSANEPNSSRRTDRASITDSELMDELRNVRKPIAGDVPISDVITPLVKEGDLYHKLDDNAVHCYACGHNCKIKPGARGICQVRYNLNGKLFVPWGYVAALQCDPTEKKPFFHIYPGSDTLTFGMMGCDLHCSYCFTGDTVVITDRGPITLQDAFNLGETVQHNEDGDIAYPADLCAVSGSGMYRKVRGVFKHAYRGPLAVVRPYYLPELRCTADHRLYATDDVSRKPEKIEAHKLTKNHFLAIPRRFADSASSPIIDVASSLNQHEITYRVPWDLSPDDREFVAAATDTGVSSRQIRQTLGKSASYVRHVRDKIARGLATDTRVSGPLIEADRIRFPNEHRPGLPLTLPLDEGMAQLLGYYCAEGSVVSSKARPNSHSLTFSFSYQESTLVEKVQRLLKHYFDIEAVSVSRTTTLGVSTSKSSVALLFKLLAGHRAQQKRVPEVIFNAPTPIIRAFLDAYIEGDGHRYENGKISATTCSRQLAYGIAWLALKSGYVPSIYDTAMPETTTIQGRVVNRSPHQYSVVWYEHTTIERKLIETDDYYLIPLRDVSITDYEGDVYNMEVDVEHNYLAGLLLVSNCQNWDISQTMRDANAGRPPSQVTPDHLVELAKRNGAKCVASSYNEPLITSEWAIDVFKEAKAAGFTCMYISNGNATRGVLDYIRPYTDGYKIDLKAMNDKSYRKLGGVLDMILDGIRMTHEMGFWVEIVTLIIPGFNSSEAELREAAKFISNVSPDIPWHVTAFHKDYRMQDPDNTDAKQLIRAAEIGYEAGLHYVYAGNLPGRVGKFENTFCPSCHASLIERVGYVITNYRITADGTCPYCQTKIAGIWPKAGDKVNLGTAADLYLRRPRSVRQI
jgi:pyruvate formate lyase activating enzyme